MKESGKRKFGRVALYGNTNKRTRDLFLKHVFLLEEVHLTLTFYYFSLSATLNQNYGRKKIKINKKLRFFRAVTKNTPAKFHFPTLLESGRKSVSVNVNSSPKVSKELDTLF